MLSNPICAFSHYKILQIIFKNQFFYSFSIFFYYYLTTIKKFSIPFRIEKQQLAKVCLIYEKENTNT